MNLSKSGANGESSIQPLHRITGHQVRSLLLFKNGRVLFCVLNRIYVSFICIWNCLLLSKISRSSKYNVQIGLLLSSLFCKQGVIFSIVFHTKRHLLCSVSDDRSIQLRQVRGQGSASNKAMDQWHVSDWEGAEFCAAQVFYGHTARVWDVCLMMWGMVSIGEVIKHPPKGDAYSVQDYSIQIFKKKFKHCLCPESLVKVHDKW